MKKRLMLPAMAFVFAIGLSFATESSTADAQFDWVDMGENVDPIPIPETICGLGDKDCSVTFTGDAESYPVYDDENLQNRKKGSGDVVEL